MSANAVLAQRSSYHWLILINVLITTCLAVVSAGVTIIADDVIRGELALGEQNNVWVTTLYLLGLNTMVPGANWFADRFGYRKIYAIGVLLFSLGSFLAFTSWGFWSIAIARLIEGFGAGLIFPVGMATVVSTFPKERLPLALVLYIGAAFGCGFAFGLPLSGYLAQFYNWRWIFLGLFILGLILTIVSWILHEETARKEKGTFDTFGYGFFILFIAALLIALTYGPMRSTNEGWRSPFIVGCFVSAGLSLIASILIESRQENPTIPFVLFKEPIFAISSIAMILLGMSTFASVSISMQYMIQALQYERFQAALVGIIYGVMIAICSITSNMLMKKLPAPVLTFVGLSLLTISYFLNNILDHNTGHTQVFWILFLRGMGVGFSLGPTTVLGMQHVKPWLRNQAATLLTFFRQVGATYGGTLVAIIVIKRQIFHAARFSEPVSPNIVGFQVTFEKIFSRFYSTVNEGSFVVSQKQAALAIAKNIETQAFIQAQNDAMIIFGVITGMIVCLLLGALLVRQLFPKKSDNTKYQK